MKREKERGKRKREGAREIEREGGGETEREQGNEREGEREIEEIIKMNI